MEAAVHEVSSLLAYASILRRRKWTVLVLAVLVPATAVALSLRQADAFRSSAEVYLNKQNIAAAVTGIPDTTLLVDEDRAAETQADLASVPAVARRALKLAGVSDLTVHEFLSGASAHVKGKSDLLVLSVVHRDPELARRLASAYARAFTQYRADLDTRALRRARREVRATLRGLAAKHEAKTPLYASLAEKEQRLATLETLQTSRAYVVRGADSALQIAPRPMRNALLGLLLGLVLGVGLAFAIEALDTRIRSADEIGHHLELPLLARIPPPPRGLGKAGRLVMLEQPSGPEAEAFRMLRTNLAFVRLEGDVRTILLTSAVAEEGKSTTAANLAVAEARGGKRVALVDLDLRSPSLSRLFEVRPGKGLTDVVLGEVGLEGALVPIPLDDHGPYGHGSNGNGTRGVLDLLVAGTLPPDPGELVGIAKVAHVLDHLRTTHDLVILDTPPALLVGDAAVLSARADGIVVVARANVLRRPILAELRRLLQTLPASKLGYVVTGENEVASYGYGRTYGARQDGPPPSTQGAEQLQPSVTEAAGGVRSV